MMATNPAQHNPTGHWCAGVSRAPLRSPGSGRSWRPRRRTIPCVAVGPDEEIEPPAGDDGRLGLVRTLRDPARLPVDGDLRLLAARDTAAAARRRRTRRPIHRSRPRPGSLSTRPRNRRPSRSPRRRIGRRELAVGERLVDGIPELRGRCEPTPVVILEGVAVGRRDEGRRHGREVDRGLRGQVDRGDEGVEDRSGVTAVVEQGEEIEPPADDDGCLDLVRTLRDRARVPIDGDLRLLAARDTAAARRGREVLVDPFIDRDPAAARKSCCRRALEDGGQAGLHDIESVVDLLC